MLKKYFIAALFSLLILNQSIYPTMKFFAHFGSGYSHPTGIAFDSGLNVYVADTSNNRIKKYNSSGTLIHSHPIEFS